MMEGMLCHWALAMQECNFEITHHKGGITHCQCRYTLWSKPIMHCHSSHDTSFPSLNVCISQQAEQNTSKALAASSWANNPSCGDTWQKNQWDDMWKYETNSGFAMVYYVGITSLIQCLRWSQSPSTAQPFLSYQKWCLNLSKEPHHPQRYFSLGFKSWKRSLKMFYSPLLKQRNFYGNRQRGH